MSKSDKLKMKLMTMKNVTFIRTKPINWDIKITNEYYSANNIVNFRFGVVCAFVTNQYIDIGVKALPQNLHYSLHDTSLYLNNTKRVSQYIQFCPNLFV